MSAVPSKAKKARTICAGSGGTVLVITAGAASAAAAVALALASVLGICCGGGVAAFFAEASRGGAGGFGVAGGGVAGAGVAGAGDMASTVVLRSLSSGFASGGVAAFGSAGGSGFGVVMGVIGRAAPPEKRSAALGLAGAGGSFGQFVLLPFGQSLISHIGWMNALLVLAAMSLLIVPLAAALAGRNTAAHASTQSLSAALHEAASHKGLWLLTLSLSVCGFQTVFIMIHLPAYLLDKGMSPTDGVTALALIGFFNIIGSYACGVLGGRYSKKNLLVGLYCIRAVAITLFIALPLSALAIWGFGITMGITFLGTIPLTNGLVAQIFGVKYLSTLFSIAFLGHQIGSFLGAWYGGRIFDLTGSYATVWIFCVILSILAAALCVPVDERDVTSLRPVGDKT